MDEELLGGDWQGEYIDAHGYRADLRLSLDTDGRTVRGKAVLQIENEDTPIEVAGEVEGEVSRGTGALVIRIGATGEEIKNEIFLRSGGTFARQALFGCATTTGESGLGGGVFIAWRFAGAEER